MLSVPQAVQVVPPSQLKRNSWVSAVPGSTTSVSEMLMFEPSLTEARRIEGRGRGDVVDGDASRCSCSRHRRRRGPRRLTLRVPLSVVEQAWVLSVLQAVQVVPPSQLKRNSCVSAVPGSTTSVSADVDVRALVDRGRRIEGRGRGDVVDGDAVAVAARATVVVADLALDAAGAVVGRRAGVGAGRCSRRSRSCRRRS